MLANNSESQPSCLGLPTCENEVLLSRLMNNTVLNHNVTFQMLMLTSKITISEMVESDAPMEAITPDNLRSNVRLKMSKVDKLALLILCLSLIIT